MTYAAAIGAYRLADFVECQPTHQTPPSAITSCATAL